MRSRGDTSTCGGGGADLRRRLSLLDGLPGQSDGALEGWWVVEQILEEKHKCGDNRLMSNSLISAAVGWLP